MKINKQQIEAILVLPADKRYEHFIKVVSDWETAWGLYNNGWAMAATDNGEKIFPIWPAKEYAELCAKDEWNDYVPESFELDELLDTLLPMLKKDGVLPGVFYTPRDKGVVVSVDQLAANLKTEIEKYS